LESHVARSLSLVLLSLLLSAAFAVGCGGAAPESTTSAVSFDACRPLNLLVDEGASAVQMQGIHAAIDLWNRPAFTALEVGALPAADVAVLPVHFRTAASPSHGFYNPETGEVLINNELTDHALAVVIAHEVGHAFGLVHVTNRPSVMAPANLDVEPNADDVNALAALWGPCAAPVQSGQAQ
jgi:hypothetical protein